MTLLRFKALLHGSLTAFLGMFIASAYAMTFEVVEMRGEPAIIAKGEIIEGDAKRLKKVFKDAARHSMGYFALVLDSPGGSIAAAFELSKVIDAHNVNTYVPPGAECVSACAMIVFIAGREHIAVPGGYLGFHGCYDSRTRKIVGLCNEAIAEHAVAHGTAYGSVMAFIETTPHDQVVWFGGENADCWGINRYVISPKPANYDKCVRDMIRDITKRQ